MIMKHIDSPELSHLLATVIWPLFEKIFEEGSGLRNLEDVLYYLFKASSHLKEEQVVQQVQNLLSFEDAQEVIILGSDFVNSLKWSKFKIQRNNEA